jgi:DNA-binding GntR family transcriptional regulator
VILESEPGHTTGPDGSNLRDRMYRSLKADIMAGVFDLGEQLSAGELAKSYGVSKTPVREALSLLEREGWVEANPRVGYVTSSVTLRDVEDIFDLRLVVEVAAIERATAAITEEGIERLEQLTSRYLPGNKDSYRLFLRENLEFHRQIAEASGNRRLAQVVTELLEHMQRLLILRLDFGSGDEMIDEHCRMVAALRRRDLARSSEIMATSITNARQAVIESLVKRMANWNL